MDPWSACIFTYCVVYIASCHVTKYFLTRTNGRKQFKKIADNVLCASYSLTGRYDHLIGKLWLIEHAMLHTKIGAAFPKVASANFPRATPAPTHSTGINPPLQPLRHPPPQPNIQVFSPSRRHKLLVMRLRNW